MRSALHHRSSSDHARPAANRAPEETPGENGQGLIVEEVLPFIEWEHQGCLRANRPKEIGVKTFFRQECRGPCDGGELNPDLVAGAVGRILGIVPAGGFPEAYAGKNSLTWPSLVPRREQTFLSPAVPTAPPSGPCARPRSADARGGFVCGDIGCYAMGSLFPAAGVPHGQDPPCHGIGDGPGFRIR